MSLNQVINTRSTDYEDKGQLLNVAGLTLTNAAVAANEPVRKGEFDAGIAALSFDNVVESTEASIADYVTANGTGLSEGTLLILSNAPERLNRWVRRDYAVSNDGTVNDFINVNPDSGFTAADLDAEYDGSDGVFIDATNGFIGISQGGLQFDRLNAAAQAEVTSRSKTIEYAVVWGAADGNGISTATVDTSSDFGTRSVNVRILKDLGDGYCEHISTSTIEVASNSISVRLRTDSGSIIAATHVIEVTGVPVV